jgi:hypothetical protein
MPWLEDVSSERYDEIRFSRKVGGWPKPGTQRIGGFFRFIQVHGFPRAIASRYFFKFTPFEGELTNLWCWLDIDQVSEDKLQGASGLSADGREVILEVEQYNPPAVDPNLGISGVTWRMHWLRAGFGPWYLSYTWPTFVPTIGAAPYVIFKEPGTFSPWAPSNNWIGTSPKDWTSDPPQQNMTWFSISECYDIEPAPPGPGFAQGNGIDAYVQLDSVTGPIVNRWEWSGDFYYRSFVRAFALCHGGAAGNITGISATHAYFATISVPHGGAIPLDTWVNIRVERSWQSPVGALMKVFLDDVEVGSAVQGNPSRVFDRMIGGRGTVPEQFGNFDCKNFKLQTGTPETPVIELQMPLENNACDEGPAGNNGSTFNMPLPSCP